MSRASATRRARPRETDHSTSSTHAASSTAKRPNTPKPKMSNTTKSKRPKTSDKTNPKPVKKPKAKTAKRSRLAKLGLRSRITFAFALTSLLLSTIISLATLGLTRQNLVRGHEVTSFSVFVNNGRRVLNELTAETDDEGRRAIVERLGRTSRTFPLLRVGDAWTAADPLVFGSESVPTSLLELVDTGTPARMRTRIDDRTVNVSALPISGTGIEAAYFEAAPLDHIEGTLDTLAVILLGVAAMGTLVSALLGSWAARRLLNPLMKVCAAAEALADGALDTRLMPPGSDPDLGSLAASFNGMASALEDRIARDARFASAVGHELRSPLMTLTASVEVLANNSDKLSERGRIALDLLTNDIAHFHRLVEDLLEINRYDVGIADLRAEPVDVVEFVRQAVAMAISHHSNTKVECTIAPGAEGTTLWADKRRLGQVVANLVDNAAKYGNGEVRVSVERRKDRLLLSVEDNGPGIVVEEREVIFDRFNRGSVGSRRGHNSGSGLGLALVSEHVGLHQGRVWAEDRPDAVTGARFVVELPISEDSTGSNADTRDQPGGRST